MVEHAVDDTESMNWFQAPTELGDAVRAVANGAQVLAGGTDLVPSLAHREPPNGIVWIGRLGLDTVAGDSRSLSIGAAASLAEVASNPMIQEAAAALASAAGRLAGPAVRNQATIGGSLCAAWPRSDIGCSLLALDAAAVAAGQKRNRHIPLTDFYLASGGTSLQPDEIVTEITLPPAARSAFIKIGRRAHMSLPVVNAATCIEVNGGVISKAAVAVGTDRYPQRAPSVETALVGSPLNEDRARKAAQLVLDDMEMADDEQASAWYRTRVAPVAVARAIEAAIAEGTTS
jgi:aerobic carbon-monoxide dehydrogenase medium subunit